MSIAAEGSRTLSNRVGPERLYAFIAVNLLRVRVCSWPAVFDLQEQRIVSARYLNPRVATKGVTPHVAQTFRNDLKEFRRQTIVDLHFATRFDVNLDAG